MTEMTEMTANRLAMQSAVCSYYTYAALYCEGYYCCANGRLPARHRV